MNTPIVTVIISVYNTEDYVRQSIESVLAQTFIEWELILIDDGSTDASSLICDEFSGKDLRIKVVHKQNTGQADSRNQAIDMARGEYVCFLDSDDWVSCHLLERLVKEAETTLSDIAVCSYYEEYIGKQVVVHNDHVGVFNRQQAFSLYYQLQNRTCYVIWGMLIKRELLSVKIPLLRYCEDTAIILQWVSLASRIVIVDEPFYHYRMRKGSVMHIEKKEERVIANLQAMQIRNHFAKNGDLIAIEEADSFDAQAYLYIAQQFVRNCPSAKQRIRVSKYASSLLNELQPLNTATVKRRTYNRWLLLKRHPLRFAWKLYITGLFSLHERKLRQKNSNLYD